MKWKAYSLDAYRTQSHFGVGKLNIIETQGTTVTLRCGYCRGKGVDYISKDQCPACHASGKVVLEQPLIGCAFCKETGRAHRNSRLTCVVCKGMGALRLEEPHAACPECRGRGRPWGEELPCIKCKGAGAITLSQEKES